MSCDNKLKIAFYHGSTYSRSKVAVANKFSGMVKNIFFCVQRTKPCYMSTFWRLEFQVAPIFQVICSPVLEDDRHMKSNSVSCKRLFRCSDIIRISTSSRLVSDLSVLGIIEISSRICAINQFVCMRSV